MNKKEDCVCTAIEEEHKRNSRVDKQKQINNMDINAHRIIGINSANSSFYLYYNLIVSFRGGVTSNKNKTLIFPSIINAIRFKV